MAISATLSNLWSFPPIGQFLAVTFGLGVGAFWSLQLLYPNDEELEQRILLLEYEENRLAEGYYENIIECGWELLTGVAFESFLVTVFSDLGYKVETTKVSGDQGVDLILSKGNLRVAIQAKGYPSSTVGNKAVQEAHTGMVFYGCHSAAVITNSSYTRAAHELAARVCCALIDKSQLPDLITGAIKLEDLIKRNGKTPRP